MKESPNRNTEGKPIVGPDVQDTSGPNLLLVGVITRPHGVKGEVWIKIINKADKFLDGQTSKVLLGMRQVPYELESFRVHRNGLLVKLTGCDDRNNADILRGSKVFISVDQMKPLRPNEYYVTDLIGLSVFTENGEHIGDLSEVLPTGANDVYSINGEDGEILLPAIKSVIKSVDLMERKMTVRLMPGMRKS
mgnify:FL=1